MLELNAYNDFLKFLRSTARFDWSGRVLQGLAPQCVILFWQFVQLFFGILISVTVFLKLYKELVEFATKKQSGIVGAHSINWFEYHDLRFMLNLLINVFHLKFQVKAC